MEIFTRTAVPNTSSLLPGCVRHYINYGAFLPSARAVEFQKAMAFIDGTNLFHRLDAMKLKPLTIDAMCRLIARGRDIVRIYLYTSEPYYKKALARYGEEPFRNIRIVLGDAVPTGDGNFKEKGVDALLVADLIYHAASKNYDFAILVSVDQDFARALKRVEDFGCRTAVISICASTPDLLREASDEVHEFDENDLIANNWVQRA